MKFIDLEKLEDAGPIKADLCIAGSGPAGATIAKEFAGSKVQVLIVEGGGTEETPADQALYDVENVGANRATPQDRVRNRIVGGSSQTWAGRCVSLDEIDFETRGWVPHSGWPISFQDIHPFLDRSRKYLGIGPNIYDDRLWKQLGLLATPSPDRSGIFAVAILAVQRRRAQSSRAHPLFADGRRNKRVQCKTADACQHYANQHQRGWSAGQIARGTHP